MRTIWTVRLSVAALLVAPLDDGLRGAVQIVGAVVDRLGDKAAADMLVDAVGRQQEDVAPFDRERPVVDLDLRVNARARGRDSSAAEEMTTRWSLVSCSSALPETR